MPALCLLVVGALAVAPVQAGAATATGTKGKVGKYAFSTGAKKGQSATCTFAGNTLTSITVASPTAQMRDYWTHSHGGGYVDHQTVAFSAVLQGAHGTRWTTLSPHFRLLSATTRAQRVAPVAAFTARQGLKPGYDRYRVVEILQWLRPTDGKAEGTATTTLTHYRDGSHWGSACFPAPRAVSSFKARATTRTTLLSWRNPTSPSLAKVVMRFAFGTTPPAKPTDGKPIALDSAKASSIVLYTDEGSKYAFSVWGRDARGRYSARASVVFTTPPITARTVPGVTGIRAIAPGNYHTCALITGGTVTCWGYGGAGQLGNGSFAADDDPPAPVPGLTGVTALASGLEHTCAIISDGTVKCWGLNNFGELGDGTTTSRSTPVTVAGLSSVVALSAGPSESESTCATLSSGTVKCWGFNGAGELGDGTVKNRSTPVTVVGVTGATRVGVGYLTACALTSGGTVKCWGDNSAGEFGDGTTTSSLTAVPVSGITGANSLAVGGGHSCAGFSSGQLKCWGANNFGQLGDGTTTRRLTPVSTIDPDPASAPTAGESHTCSMTVGGGVSCWGSNQFAVLGDGSTADRHYATRVADVSNAVAVTSGDWSACAVLGDGTAKCWGLNTYAQLGYS